MVPKPSGTPKEAEARAQKSRVIGWSGEFLMLGDVQSEAGETVEVKWSSSGAVKVARAEVAPVVPAAQLKEGHRVAAPLGASSKNAAVGTVTAVVNGERIKIKWDLDGKEEEISSMNVALLIRPLCKAEKGCKLGVGKEPGSSAESGAPVAGVAVGSWLAVKYEVKGATYWGAGEVKEIHDDGFTVNVRGHGEVKAPTGDIRRPLKAGELKPGMAVQHGAPPGGLVPGYVVSVEGDTAQVSATEGGTFPQARKIGAEVFQAQ